MTKETNVSVKINLDGTGIADSTTGIPFLDHMLDVSTNMYMYMLFCFVMSQVHFFSGLELEVVMLICRETIIRGTRK